VSNHPKPEMDGDSSAPLAPTLAGAPSPPPPPTALQSKPPPPMTPPTPPPPPPVAGAGGAILPADAPTRVFLRRIDGVPPYAPTASRILAGDDISWWYRFMGDPPGSRVVEIKHPTELRA